MVKDAVLEGLTSR